MGRVWLAVFWVLCLSGAVVAGPEYWRHEWPRTDFSRTTVDSWVEIVSGGPAKDGIPALSAPGFLPVARESRIGGREPVIALELAGAQARAYPLRYLTWHEIVNDVVADLPVAVTFCPLCNSAVVFDRRVGERVLEFGVSGKLRNSDMIMYDRQTESWWQQAVGLGIVGEMTGVDLAMLPAWVESWEAFRARNPDGLVMDEPAWTRPYGRNPYVGYDSASRPFLYGGDVPPHGIAPLARVVRVGDRAWPLTRLAAAGEIAEDGLHLTWRSGAASALDSAAIGQGREVGDIRVFDQDGRDVVHDVMFAFAFHAFWPDGRWMLGD
ncbi:DUF3179 domain-containing protein [Mesobacterium sp. TK19101]|uniref:DUF3179 domain-containing protein n=1 Tax=Mesobacterium hydrothermale TaxID=3111907 RepID=A0ABU6HKS5_9RHOB|nr:DUF3179 domain-containing protein [Mesobacterium sp. TK19101]MEC3863055.1 DUF3179 domain-containing protein [Mesobacterium sp. TK19101]